MTGDSTSNPGDLQPQNPQSLSGYGRRLYFDGDESRYELFEVKFISQLRIQNLHSELAKDTPDQNKNALIFAELSMCLDDKSLQLIIRDAKDDGKKSLAILREHYLGKSKPRIISLYSELASLKMSSEETTTDYILRAESAATQLKSAGETISDSLLVAMCLKGLPDRFNSFATVITQREDDPDFVKFKAALRSFEEGNKARETSSNHHGVMQLTCYACRQPGHKAAACPNRSSSTRGKPTRGKSSGPRANRWCSICKMNNHDTKFCGKNRNAAKTVSQNNNDNDDSYEPHSFSFMTANFNTEMCESENFVNQCLLVDSGCTSHIVCDKEKFVKFDEDFDPSSNYIVLADNTRSNNVVQGRGEAKICLQNRNGKQCEVTLHDALYIPSYKQNIFSVQAATGKGATVNFANNSSELISKDGVKFDIVKRGRLYYLNHVKASSVVSRTLAEWHVIFGHCNVSDILKMEKYVVGMKILDRSQVSNFRCEVCFKGKMTQFTEKAPDDRAKVPLQSIASDLAGPVTPEGREGFKYSMNFVDECTGIIYVNFLISKSDAYKAFEQFLSDTRPYGTVLKLRSDNGLEYTSSAFQDVVLKNKIKHEFTCNYSPHQNGHSERAWRSLFEMARCLILESGLPKNMWTYAVRYAAYIRNRCYSSRLGKTPHEVYTGKQPNVNKMVSFGSKCFAYQEHKRKLDDRCREGIFLGFDNRSPAYLVYHKDQNVIYRYRTVNFSKPALSTAFVPGHEEIYELPLYKNSSDNLQTEQPPAAEASPASSPATHVQPAACTLPAACAQPSEHSPTALFKEQNNDAVKPKVNNNVKLRRSSREKKPPKHLNDFYTNVDEIDGCYEESSHMTLNYCYAISSIPSNYTEAVQTPQASEWKKAMDNEIEALKDAEAFSLVRKPLDKTVISSRWIYDLKPGMHNEPRYKARFVARGCHQKLGRDYAETFAPTAKMTSIRMLMQIASKHNMSVSQMDVKSAFVHADLNDYDIFIHPPQGYETFDTDGTPFVWHLHKSLYGLKQSGRNWHLCLDDFLQSNNFIQSESDPCLYTRVTESSVIIILAWVDDLLIISDHDNDVSEFKSVLSKRFKMKDLGKLSWFLGMKFTFLENFITMDQSDFIRRVLEKFHMEDSHPRTLPCDIHVNKFDFSESPLLEDPRLFREITGSLIYIMVCTRPDLSFVVTKLSQYMSAPTQAHLNIAKNVLKYLKGSIDKCLKFSAVNTPLSIFGYCDSDWAGDSDRKSISGYCFKLSVNGPLISWKSKKQNVVALSSCEAEYNSLTFAIMEGKFLSQLFSDMYNIDKDIFHLYVDNKAAINLAYNPVYHQRTKHVDVKMHFCRHEIKSKNVALVYVNTADNCSDIFTKPVSKAKLEMFSLFGK